MFRGLPKDVDFMAAVDDAASGLKVNGTLTPLWVYDPYEGRYLLVYKLVLRGLNMLYLVSCW